MKKLKRVNEVIKGAAMDEYGNTLGGVINIVFQGTWGRT